MELWLDTIDTATIQDATQRLAITGVTTNPSLLSQSPLALDQILKNLLAAQNGFVAVQVTEENPADMLIQAQYFAAFDKRIIVKVPVTLDGLWLMKQLASMNINTMATAIFEPSQIYLSMLAGAKYAAPYVSKIAKTGADYIQVLTDMMQIINVQKSPIKLLAASIHDKTEIIACAKLGIHAITLSSLIHSNLISNNYSTISCLNTFKDDWKNRKKVNASSH